MAFSGQMPVKLVGGVAGAGLTGAGVQYTFVKLSADQTVVQCAAATDKPIGVLQAPVNATGDPVDVVVVGETMIQGATTTTALKVGYGISTNATGYAMHVEASVSGGAQNLYYLAGMVTNVAGGTSAGNLVTAVINCASMPLATVGI